MIQGSLLSHYSPIRITIVLFLGLSKQYLSEEYLGEMTARALHMDHGNTFPAICDTHGVVCQERWAD